jgi:hypothetical protein
MLVLSEACLVTCEQKMQCLEWGGVGTREQAGGRSEGGGCRGK